LLQVIVYNQLSFKCLFPFLNCFSNHIGTKPVRFSKWRNEKINLNYMASVLTIIEAKISSKFLIKKNIVNLWLWSFYNRGRKVSLWPQVITEAKRHPLLASS